LPAAQVKPDAQSSSLAQFDLHVVVPSHAKLPEQGAGARHAPVPSQTCRFPSEQPAPHVVPPVG
jgi:hypothetical protein